LRSSEEFAHDDWKVKARFKNVRFIANEHLLPIQQAGGGRVYVDVHGTGFFIYNPHFLNAEFQVLDALALDVVRCVARRHDFDNKMRRFARHAFADFRLVRHHSHVRASDCSFRIARHNESDITYQDVPTVVW
jgi:hypothetical protein